MPRSSAGGAVERVVLVSRDLPLLESSNAAVLLAGLGLDPELEVDERLGGAPATLDAVSSARPRTLVIGVDIDPAGAAAVLTADRGLQVRTAARVARSLPVRTRNATGDVHDYGDPRLLHERGLIASLAAAWVDTPAAVAGVDHERAADLCIGNPPPLPTTGASSGLFALAAMAEAGTTGPLVAVEQASLSGHHGRRRRGADAPPGTAGAADARGRIHPRRRDPDLAGRLRAGIRGQSPLGGRQIRRQRGVWTSRRGTASAPTERLATEYELVPLPRTGTVYTEVTVHMPVPGTENARTRW